MDHLLLTQRVAEPCKRASQWSVDIAKALRRGENALQQASKASERDEHAVVLIMAMCNSILGPDHTRQDFPTDKSAMMEDFVADVADAGASSSRYSEDSSCSWRQQSLVPEAPGARLFASAAPQTGALRSMSTKDRSDSASARFVASTTSQSAFPGSSTDTIPRYFSENAERAPQRVFSNQDDDSPSAPLPTVCPQPCPPLNCAPEAARTFVSTRSSQTSIMSGVLSTCYGSDDNDDDAQFKPAPCNESASGQSDTLCNTLSSLSIKSGTQACGDASGRGGASETSEASGRMTGGMLVPGIAGGAESLHHSFLRRSQTANSRSLQHLLSNMQAGDVVRALVPSLSSATGVRRSFKHSLSWHSKVAQSARDPASCTETWPVTKILRHGYSALCAVACQWDLLNSFKLDKMLQRQSLVVMGYTLVQRNRKLDALGIRFEKLCNFLSCVQELYTSAPYHNARHATHVTWAAHALLHMTNMAYMLQPLEMMAMYVAAICHDIGHKGTSSLFQMKTRSRSTLVFDQSPIENCHLALTSLLVDLRDNDFLENLTPVERSAFLGLIRRLVLGTDIALHNQIVGEWNARLPKLKLLSRRAAAASAKARGLAMEHSARNSVTGEGDDGGSEAASSRPKSFLNQLDTEAISDRELVLMMLLKCADLSHTAIKTDVHLCWVARLEEEVWCQGDMERSLGFDVSGVADRSSGKGLQTTQVGFFSAFVMPMYTTFQDVFPATKKVRDLAQANYDYWLAKAESEK